MPLPDSDEGVAESAASPEEHTLLASPQLLADLEHPWLGLESFREATRAYFFGRDAEISELHLRLRSNSLLVLFARAAILFACAAILVTAVAIIACFAARAAAQRATKARSEAEKLLAFMIYYLRDKLEPIGQLNLLDAVYEPVRTYLDAFGEQETPELLRLRSAQLVNAGDLLRARGDLTGALKSYQDSLTIREKLAKQDPSNAGLQGDLAFSYFRTGTTLARADPKSKTEAREMVRKAQDILRSLKERTGLTAQQQGWLNSIESVLREIGD
jgi:tetratricopeptide (TPR) repeat protein